jgi:predicted amidohydrolase
LNAPEQSSVAESWRLRPSSSPPGMYTIDLAAPNRWNKTAWDPSPNHTRPIPLTASICLDLAIPFQFGDLESKPALILAPARTWERSVAYAMWYQVKKRAHELDTMILWCDGGEAGLSGVVGRGHEEITQVGQGSWVKSVGIQYPFDDGASDIKRHGVSLVCCMLLTALLLFHDNTGVRNLRTMLTDRRRNREPVVNLLD